MNKVFVYVGHSNWGKSMALKVLTNNSSHKKRIQVGHHIVRVRKMSNDDYGQGLLNWVRAFPYQNYEKFIISFCPKLPPIEGEATAEQTIALDILTVLQRSNELYFFVQKEKYNSPVNFITENEINGLRVFGTVEVLYGQNNDIARANAFLNFITQHI
jgi:hypothetical protein